MKFRDLLLSACVLLSSSALAQTRVGELPVIQTVGGDKVLNVYLCGNDLGIQMQKAGWLVVLESAAGQKQVDRIMSIAMAMQSTGRSPNWYNPGTAVSWCATPNVRPITVFGIAAG
jgi:hypothetical protein